MSWPRPGNAAATSRLPALAEPARAGRDTVGRAKASHFLLCARAEGRFDFERPSPARAEGPFFFGVFWFCTRVRVLMAFHLRH